MGVMIAPVAGSGSWPAWMQRVLKRASGVSFTAAIVLRPARAAATHRCRRLDAWYDSARPRDVVGHPCPPDAKRRRRAGRRGCRRRRLSSGRPPADAPEPGLVALRRLLLQRWPGRLLLGGLALKLARWPDRARRRAPTRRHRPARHARPPRLSSSAARSSSGGSSSAPGTRAAVARPRAAGRLLPLHRRRAGAAHRRVLPVRRRADVLQRQRLPLQDRRRTTSSRTRRVIAQAAAEEIERSDRGAPVQAVLDRYVSRAQARYPGLSLVLVPRQADVRRQPAIGPRAGAHRDVGRARRRLGAHDRRPIASRPWVGRAASAASSATRGAAATSRSSSSSRAVGAQPRRSEWSVVVDVPIDEQVWTAIHQTTGIELGELTLSAGRDGAPSPPPAARRRRAARRARASRPRTGAKWVVELGRLHARSGTGSRRTTAGVTAIGSASRRATSSAHLVGAEPRQGRSIGRDQRAVILGFIGVLFLVIEFAAFVMGWRWRDRSPDRSTRSSTAPSGCARATSRHRIPIRSRDQLGELAESFNAMTANIEDLLRAGGGEAAPRGGAAHRPRDPDVAAAARRDARCPGSRVDRALRAGARGRRRLLRLLPARRRAPRRARSPTWRARARRPRSTWRSSRG